MFSALNCRINSFQTVASGISGIPKKPQRSQKVGVALGHTLQLAFICLRFLSRFCWNKGFQDFKNLKISVLNIEASEFTTLSLNFFGPIAKKLSLFKWLVFFSISDALKQIREQTNLCVLLWGVLPTSACSAEIVSLIPRPLGDNYNNGDIGGT